MSQYVFHLDRFTYTYPENDRPALRDISLDIREGEFVLLLGASGSGKSTFLRSLNGLVPRFYGGRYSGEVWFRGRPLPDWTHRELVCGMGFLHQDPERQLLLETVERELVFGMENLGMSLTEMRSRLAEMSHLFGLGALMERKTTTLSGGERQRIALAGVLAAYPSVLLLDEPTSQLDPVHAEEVLHAIRRLNEEWGLTVVISEHRLERCFHLADRLLLFEQGQLAFDGPPREFVRLCADGRSDLQVFLPPVARHLLHLPLTTIPLTVKEARQTLLKLDRSAGEERLAKRDDPAAAAAGEKGGNGERTVLLQLDRGKAGYEKSNEVLRGISYSICSGERIALMGENGAGKSTLAKVLAGILPLTAGKLYWHGEQLPGDGSGVDAARIGYLTQNPNDYFLHDTVEAEIQFALHRKSQPFSRWGEEGERLLASVGLLEHRHRHPHDLSGGERQRLALAIMLALQPEILLLDEPTRGLDVGQKERLCQLLAALPTKAVMVITHDVEFADMYANRVSILYQGELVADGSPEDVFGQSFSYMPQVYKLYRGMGWRR